MLTKYAKSPPVTIFRCGNAGTPKAFFFCLSLVQKPYHKIYILKFLYSAVIMDFLFYLCRLRVGKKTHQSCWVDDPNIQCFCVFRLIPMHRVIKDEESCLCRDFTSDS